MSVDAARGCGNGPGSTRITPWPRFFNSIAAVTPSTPAPTTMTLDILEACHSERSEESQIVISATPHGKPEMFRFAQHDKENVSRRVQNCHGIPALARHLQRVFP